jgi:Uma2 family endonuclease
MSAPVPKRMTADEFIAWAMVQPEGLRHELVAGEVIAMAPERAAHARTKLRFARRFMEVIEVGQLACEAYGGGMAVRVDANTVFEPDVPIRCGQRLNDDATEITDPIVVVEVVSPSSQKRDSGSKLEGYFQIPSVRHYLIVKTENHAIIHHRRDEEGKIATHIVRSGVLRLDPPGLIVTGLFVQ